MARRKYIHNMRRHPSHRKNSPFKQGGKGWDRLQTGLSFAGTILPAADALNALVSGGRAVHAKKHGTPEDVKKHTIAMGINAAAIIPGVGEAYKAIKGAKGIKKLTETGKQLGKRTEFLKQGKEAVKTGKDIIQTIKTGKGVVPTGKRAFSTAGNVGYWGGTSKQMLEEVKGTKTKAEKRREKYLAMKYKSPVKKLKYKYGV